MSATARLSKNTPRVRKFPVVEQWRILADDAEKLGDQALELENANHIFSIYATALFFPAKCFREKQKRSMAWFDFRMDGHCWHPLFIRNKKKTEVRFTVKEWQWLRFLRNCETIEHPPEAMIAAAFGIRAKGFAMPGDR